jgi:hypothetical protein
MAVKYRDQTQDLSAEEQTSPENLQNSEEHPRLDRKPVRPTNVHVIKFNTSVYFHY